jgi:hypothetical protein
LNHWVFEGVFDGSGAVVDLSGGIFRKRRFVEDPSRCLLVAGPTRGDYMATFRRSRLGVDAAKVERRE